MILVPVTARPTSLGTTELSVIVEEPSELAVSVRTVSWTVLLKGKVTPATASSA